MGPKSGNVEISLFFQWFLKDQGDHEVRQSDRGMSEPERFWDRFWLKMLCADLQNCTSYISGEQFFVEGTKKGSER